MGCSSRSSPKREFTAVQSHPRNKRNTSRQPNCTPEQLEKEEQKLPKIIRRKEIIKIQAEINEKEMIETVVKINKTKS